MLRSGRAFAVDKRRVKRILGVCSALEKSERELAEGTAAASSQKNVEHWLRAWLTMWLLALPVAAASDALCVRLHTPSSAACPSVGRRKE